MTANRLNLILKKAGVQRKVDGQWILSAPYCEKGYTESKTFSFTHSDGSPDSKLSTRWTQRGRRAIHEILASQGVIPVVDMTGEKHNSRQRVSERPFWDVPFTIHLWGVGEQTVTPPYGVLSSRANGQNCPLLKDVRRSVRFSVRPWSGILPPHFGLLRFPTDAYNRPNFGQLPCEPSMGFHTEICRLHDFPSRRVDKNRSERRVEAHRGICRTWPDAEHIPLHLIFTRFPA